MGTRDEIKARSLAALKARDKETRQRLEGVLTRFTETEKEVGFSGWTDEKEREIVAGYTKRLRGAVEEMPGTALAAAYQAEIDLLQPWLPQMLDAEGTRALVAPLAAQARSIGQFLGLVMKAHKGKVDPAVVRRIGGELGLK